MQYFLVQACSLVLKYPMKHVLYFLEPRIFLLNWLQWMMFTIFSGTRVCCKDYENHCSLEFIHGVFLMKRAAIYKIPIKPCVRNLIQHYSLERIRLNKTWMTLKLTKILVSLLVMNPLKKNDRGSDDQEYDPKFLH